MSILSIVITAALDMCLQIDMDIVYGQLYLINSSPPGQMASISETFYSDEFLWMKDFVIQLKFH